MTQMRLEELSGVDQTMISRLERGRAPAASLYKLLRLQAILGAELPLGYCPHDHDCPWRSTAGPPPPRMTALQRWRQMGLVV